MITGKVIRVRFDENIGMNVYDIMLPTGRILRDVPECNVGVDIEDISRELEIVREWVMAEIMPEELSVEEFTSILLRYRTILLDGVEHKVPMYIEVKKTKNEK